MGAVKPGRKSVCTKALVTRICNRLAAGETLNSICRSTKGMPSGTTVRRWQSQHEWVAKAVADARVSGFDVIAESCIDIADDRKADADPASRKVRVWTRLQLLSKWDPKRYGERMTLAGDKHAPIEHRHTMTDAELEAIAKGSSHG